MNRQILGASGVEGLGDLWFPVPGTDFTKWGLALQSYLSLPSWFEAANIAGKVWDAYPAVSKAAGTPYQVGTPSGEAMVSEISKQTGLSFGRTKAALNVLEQLAAKGDIGSDSYNPGKFSTGARVATAAKAAISNVKKAASAVTPKSVQDLATGLGEGVSGVGTLLSVLPWLAVGGLGIWAWSVAKSGKGLRVPGPLGRLLQ